MAQADHPPPNQFVRAVIFDLGGTLKDVSDRYEPELSNRTLASWLWQTLPGLDEGIFLERWRKAWKEAQGGKRAARPERTAHEILREVLTGLEPFANDGGDDSSSSSALNDELIDKALQVYYQHELDCSELLPGALEALEAVVQQGRRVVVLSNSADSAKQRQLVRLLGLDRFFRDSDIVLSSDLRYRKPDSRIFRSLLADVLKGEIPAERCVMVGDMLSRDVLGARWSGMLSILLRNPKSERSNEAYARNLGLEPDVRIESLAQLPQALLELDRAAALFQQPAEGAKPEWPKGVRPKAFAPQTKLRIGFAAPASKLARMRKNGLFDTSYRADLEILGVNLEKDLDDGSFPPLSALMVKITSLMTRALYFQEPLAVKQLLSISRFMAGNPSVPVIGVGPTMGACVSRWKALELLREIPQPASVRDANMSEPGDGEEGGSLAPASVYFPAPLLSEPEACKLGRQAQLELFDRLASVRYPVICKSTAACGLPSSHAMVIVTGPEDQLSLGPEERALRRGHLELLLRLEQLRKEGSPEDQEELAELEARALAEELEGKGGQQEGNDEDEFLAREAPPLLRLLRPVDRKLLAELSKQVLRAEAESRRRLAANAGLLGEDEARSLREMFPLERPDEGWLVQEYLSRSTAFFKVYVLGDFVAIKPQKTLPDLGAEPEPRAAVFDSQAVKEITPDWEALAEGQFAPGAAPAAKNAKEARSPAAGVSEQVKSDISWIAGRILESMGLEFFGFDALATEDGFYRVVDVNYFPSYGGVEDFPSMFAELMWKKVSAANVRGNQP